MTLRNPGRPRDNRKSAAIIAAAAEVFFERGFTATTVDAVAERAGVSKVTIYARFGDKAGLFEAFVKHVSDRMQHDYVEAAALPASVEDALISLGTGVMTELLSPQMRAFEQNLAGDLAHHPDLARRFYEAGPGACRQQLAEIIARGAQNGELAVTDPMLAAAHVYGLWQGFHMVEARFGVDQPIGKPEIEAMVKEGVARFLRAYRA